MNSHDLIMQMRRLIAEYDSITEHQKLVNEKIAALRGGPAEWSTQVPDPSKDRKKRIVSMVGLSLGDEEVRDAGYTRQKIGFTEHADGMWRNDGPVYFGIATGTYGADSIIIEGVDIKKKTVALMALPVLCHAGINGVGFAPNTLSVTPDVMRDATRGDQPEQAPVSDEFDKAPPPSAKELAMYEMPRVPVSWPQYNSAALARAQEGLRTGDRHYLDGVKRLRGEPVEYSGVLAADHEHRRRTKDFDSLAEMQKHGLLSASGLNPAPEPEPEGEPKPRYCDKCERISLHRRNQIASMGHMVSHLVELPSEQGYALPCKSCRC